VSAVGIVFGLGLSSVALGLLIASRSAKKSKALPSNNDGGADSASGGRETVPQREPLKEPVWTPQTPAEVEEVLKVACRCVFGAPQLSDDMLAECIWRNKWRGTPYPGASVDGDHPSVAEALAVVHLSVEAARGGECEAYPELDPQYEGDDHGSVEPDEDDGDSKTIEPKAVDMNALTRLDPTPGSFYQVREGDSFLGDQGIVAQALYRAVIVAAQAKGWSKAKAQSRAVALAADAKARVAYLHVIQCSPWNDALYGTWGYGKHAMPAPHGRAIRLVPKHDRVYDRLADGQSPIRTLDWGAPADKGTGSATGAGDAYELLWLPPLRSDALLDVNRQQQVVADGLVWPGGLTKYNPPLSVLMLAIVNVPPPPWGCEGIGA
jgi:hypothetical protein